MPEARGSTREQLVSFAKIRLDMRFPTFPRSRVGQVQMLH